MKVRTSLHLSCHITCDYRRCEPIVLIITKRYKRLHKTPLVYYSGVKYKCIVSDVKGFISEEESVNVVVVVVTWFWGLFVFLSFVLVFGILR